MFKKRLNRKLAEHTLIPMETGTSGCSQPEVASKFQNLKVSFEPFTFVSLKKSETGERSTGSARDFSL
jgi:hypothetical protein